MDKKSLYRWCNPEVILVATNLADGNALIPHAVSQAKTHNARILLVHAIAPAELSLNERRGLPFAIACNVRQDAQKRIDKMARELQSKGTSCEPILVEGYPAEQLPAPAKEFEADRVLMCCGNTISSETSMKGELANHLIGVFDVPICFIGRNVVAPRRSIDNSGAVLFASSLRPISQDVAWFCSKLAEFYQAPLTLLHVANRNPTFLGGSRDRRIRVENDLRDLLDEESVLWDEPTIVVREGDAAAEILEEADSRPTRLIVLGVSPSSTTVRRPSLSVVEHVIASARCPVITLKLSTPPISIDLNKSLTTGIPFPVESTSRKRQQPSKMSDF